MHYGEIKKCDIANGEGVRVSLFVSGCTHRCKGCFNPETWDFNYGKKFDEEAEQEIFSQLDEPFIDGLSLLGGEPMEPANQKVLLPFLRKVVKRYPQKNIWCYTGYTLEVDLVAKGKAFTEYTDEILSYIDVLVDGEFIEELKDIRLVFRGSSNQRILKLKEMK
ncbi:MAG: anaerobic ribonucleoside-triphosphate reductase activating protein [Eubacteriales bacterium]